MRPSHWLGWSVSSIFSQGSFFPELRQHDDAKAAGDVGAWQAAVGAVRVRLLADGNGDGMVDGAFNSWGQVHGRSVCSRKT
jgi:hypothetical protein